MATSYPASLDSFTNPTAVDTLDSPPHDTQHADANDAIEALQAKVGVDSSAVTTSLDYRVAQLETGGGGMTVSSTAPSSPAEGDMWYDDTSGRTYVYYDDGSSQQWVEFGAPPSGIGKILQVVSTTKTDIFSASVAQGASTAITGLSASITPSSASSTILVIGQINAAVYATNAEAPVAVLTRGGTPISIGDAAGVRSRGTSQSGITLASTDLKESTNSVGIVFVDSPATTSATTYAVELGHTNFGTATVYVNTGGNTALDRSDVWRTTSTITVMEIAP
jgi:hypothetical protein